MKIVTVNVPESYVDAIAKLTGDGGLYPSRSELIRNAVREFLLKELRLAKWLVARTQENDVEQELETWNKETEKELKEIDEKNLVRIPVDKKDENNEPIRAFKTYKIVRRLDSSITHDEEGIPGLSEEEINEIKKQQQALGLEYSAETEKYKPTSIDHQREMYPQTPDYKFINE